VRSHLSVTGLTGPASAAGRDRSDASGERTAQAFAVAAARARLCAYEEIADHVTACGDGARRELEHQARSHQ